MLQSQYLQHQRVTLKPSLRRMLQSQHLQHQRVIAIASFHSVPLAMTIRFPSLRRMLQSQHLQHQRVIAIAMSVPDTLR
ncbi:MAG: hypothetical protein WBA41_26860 [Rivularia sp. (in: cyanobacteria)]